MLPKVKRDDQFANQNNNITRNGDTTTSGGGTTGTNTNNNKIMRLLSATTTGVDNPNPVDNSYGDRGSGIAGMGRVLSSKGVVRRPISTKSAHLSTIPLEPTFLSPHPHYQTSSSSNNNNTNANASYNHQQQISNRPYLPYSANPHIKVGGQGQVPPSSPHQYRVQVKKSSTASSQSNRKGEMLYKSEYSSYVNRARSHSHRNKTSASNGKTWSARGGVETSTNGMPFLVPKTAKQRISSSKIIITSSTDSQCQQSNDEKNLAKSATELQTSGIHLVGGGMLMGSGKQGNMAMNGSGGGISSSLTKDRMQVCRTKEEKEKNPDTIRLDKRAVRVFPEIGGGESTTLKLLSLQHNLITRLENVPLLSQLMVLDLYDNRVERICGLQGLPSLRVLLLGKNRIKRIEGLDSLKRLEILDLHGNQLRYVDNLGSLSTLRVLNLAGNLLRNIRNLGPYGLSSLTELNLKRNRIKNLDGLQKAPHLKKLLLANNDLQNVSALAPLRKLLFLNELVIEPNPLIGTVGLEYQSQVLTLFPNLTNLDRNPVTEEMKNGARLWHKKKLEEEERRKLEEERIRQEMSQTVGPPGSREQVIYQARRRWESLRNYVKSSGNGGPAPEGNGHTNGKRPTVMKSMKKVATVVTEVKTKKQGELLYPPATLDLDEFPDGQELLDKTESMLSCESYADTYRQNDKKKEKGLDVQEHVHDDKSSFTPNLNKVEIRQKKSICSTINQKKQSGAETLEDGLQDNCNDDKDEVAPNVKEVLDVAERKDEEKEEEDHLNLIESQCPSRCSARSGNSAKVAVVRPLIHRSDHITVMDESDAALLSPPLSKDSCPEVCNKETAIVLLNGDANEEVVESRNEILTPAPADQLPQAQVTNQDKPISAPAPEENEQSQQTIRSESARVKSKLLKHLRSVSLDSYPHPFLRPPTAAQKPGDSVADSSVNSASPMIPSDVDDDYGIEEDDDNDNEVIQDYDCDDDDAYSIATSTGTTVTSGSTPRRSSTVMATTNRLLKNGVFRKQTFPRTRSQRIKIRDRAAKLFGSTSELSPKSTSGTTTSKRVNSGTGIRIPGDSNNGPLGRPSTSGRILRRCDSAASLTTSGLVGSSTSSSILVGSATNAGNTSSKINSNGGNDTGDNQGGNGAGPYPFRKQGADFLVEVEGKMLNLFGQGGLRHALTAFASNVTCHVITAKFHYISYDSIIPFFGKLRQVYPSLEHFHFRANNLCSLAQLDSLSDLQGLTSLCIAKEGNPIVNHDAWANYASYRLSHWGLQVINGRAICSAKEFESLGFLALSCLPQTALTPLAKRLHMLHCFCCCSPSTSSDESNRRLHSHHARLLPSPSQPAADHGSTTSSFCTSWDDDPVLLDVIGKEALVYCLPALPPEIGGNGSSIDNNSASYTISKSVTVESSSLQELPSNINDRPSFEKRRADTLGNLVSSGAEIVEKVDMLEKIWPSLMTQVIQDMLMDFRFMDSYMKKELKKCQDITLINQQQHHHGHHHHHQHGKKTRH